MVGVSDWLGGEIVSDMRGRHAKNFDGCYIQIAGGDENLNTFLDRMDCVAQAIVLSRADTTEGNGVLTVHCAKSALSNIHKMALEDRLAVTV